MPSYKLIYFNARGGAEVCRLVFAAAGKDYIDERIERDQWPSKKPDQPMQALPVLEVDGVKYCQGQAMARYLAKEFGLMGKNNLEALRIDELNEAVSELFQALVKLYFEQDKDKKEELTKTMLAETLPKFCTFFEKRLCANNEGKGFYVGDGLTLADIILYNLMFMLRNFFQKDNGPDPFEKFDKLKALYDRVAAVPKIAEWVKKRPVTEN